MSDSFYQVEFTLPSDNSVSFWLSRVPCAGELVRHSEGRDRAIFRVKSVTWNLSHEAVDPEATCELELVRD